MKKILFVFSFLIPLLMDAQKTTTPDFAYPQQVIANAHKQLTKALAEGDGQSVVNALIKFGIAKNAVSTDNYPQVVSKTDSVIALEANPVTRCLLNLLLADIYQSYYQANQYDLDKRTTVDNSDSNFTLWSGNQFKEKIYALIDSAFADPAALQKARLADYGEIISLEKESEIFFPTIFDFASVHSLKILESLTTEYVAILPLRFLSTQSLDSPLPNILPKIYRREITIADRWVEANKAKDAPRISALLQRFNIIAPLMVNSDDESETSFDSYMQLYRENASTPYAIEFLVSIPQWSLNPQDKKILYQTLDEFGRQHPEYRRIENVRNYIKTLTNKSVNVKTPIQVAKDTEFEVEINVSNYESLEIEIYKINNKSAHPRQNQYKLSSATLYKKIPVDLSTDEVPYSKKVTVKTSINDYGLYFVKTSDFTQTSGHQFDVFRCSDIALMSSDMNRDNMVWAVNIADGQPIEGVNIELRNADTYKSTFAGNITTDRQGEAKVSVDATTIQMYPTKGTDRFGDDLSEWRYDHDEDTQTTAFINTALSVYHPGDSVDFAAIIYTYLGENRKLVRNTECEAIVRDVNNQPIDTLKLTTDQSGRVFGKIKLPKEGLTGYYRIVLKCDGFTTGHSFMVSDYKLPTFEVSIDSVTVSSNEPRTITVKGKALTYSGFPVADANVKFSVSARNGFLWWYGPAVLFHSAEGVTDSKGYFSLTLDSEVIEQSPYPDGWISVEAAVTSATGENRSASKNISIGKPYELTANFARTLKVSNKVPLDLRLFDMVGNDVPNAELKLKFSSKEKPDSLETTAFIIKDKYYADLSPLKSGTYSVTVSAPGYDALSITKNNVVVYNSNDPNCPEKTPLWLPTTQMTVSNTDNTVYLDYGTDEDNMQILVIVNTGKSIIRREWVKPARGMNKYRLDIPADTDNLTITFMAIRNLEFYRQQVNISVKNPAEELIVKIEHMRDHVAPDTQETVTIRITDGSDKAVKSSVILDMYSKALNTIVSQDWEFIPDGWDRSTINLHYSGCWNRTYNYNPHNSPYRFSEIKVPDFNLYGNSFYPIYIRGGRNYYMLSRKASGVMADTEDAMLYESVVVKEEMKSSVTSSATDYDTVEEEAMDAGNVSDESSDKKSFPQNKEEMQYRPSEIPLAFFAPDLSTDDEGRLTYSFTVPNANTTWIFEALAYNDELLTSVVSREIISSKPLMVEPNLPRFIRKGDTALVRASVMNASEDTLSVTTVFEVLNPSDMSVISSSEAVSEIAPGLSVIEQFTINADASGSAMLIRVKSSTDKFADGVQTLLPVLDDSQPVMDSKTFYLNPEQKNFETEIPKHESGQTTLLSFCENPTWEVVSALPGLRADEGITSLSVSAAIFSAAVSGLVMELNPEVESHLKEWLSGNRDEASMLSMLNRNEDLKQLVLASTPWIQEAADDAERITRLALLFDRKEITRSIDSGINRLKKFEAPDGGWCWTTNYPKASEWVTLAILNNLAELRQLGCYPSSLDPMVKRAWKFMDKKVAENFARYPRNDYMYYTYVRSLYPEISVSTGAKAAMNKTVQSLITGWKDMPTTGKAAAALILYRNGYKNVAAKVLVSLRQFSTYNPQLGMWWDSVDNSTWWSLMRTGQTAFILEAFNIIEPGCEDIDRIRQWLILNKTVQDWGTSVNASACVAAILQCGSNWLYKPGNVVINADGKPVQPSDIDKLTGSFVTTLGNQGGKLSISRTNSGPAWGAILVRSIQTMSEIKAASIPELSITKEILVKDGDNWKIANDTLQVGAIVKVRLVITSMRDMDYVTVADNRAACLEPVIQTPRPVYCDGLVFYLENRDSATNLFIDRLLKGQFVIEYEMSVNNAGSFSAGIATIQSQYTPEMTAHSAGNMINVTE